MLFFQAGGGMQQFAGGPKSLFICNQMSDVGGVTLERTTNSTSKEL